ncbi:hypothetical protein Sango_0634700 [Sesamum angolense]|uniref:Retrovirus-related Pol polyprotein from transposon TNT 1-94-like beta-barrel domain-containing protein n=1 Tax=Sesamum angolense TaxID=2727404 RepID=A0AAE1X6M0_9LAMI|nr:hypothetical protein Sango_0634700 [Sesamum angolense]
MPVTRTLSDLSKMEPLDRTNYKRWSQKLLIFFKQLDVDYVVIQNPPETTADTTTIGTTKSEDEAKHKYDGDNKTVRGHLLNHMNNSLFDLFVNYRSAKDIWTTLETRYGGDDAGRKKQVLPKQREKFKKDNHDKSFKAPDGKIQKTKQLCYCCGKPEHKAYQYYQRKDQQKASQKPATQGTPQINLAEKDNEIIAAVVVEANLVENKEDWILDTGASRHFCSNKALFHELLETMDGECVFMGNSTTAGVLVEDDPNTYMEAITSIDSSFWKEANRNELDSIMLNHTWDLVDLPIGKTIKETKRFISAQFNMKDLGETDVILGQEAEWLKNLLGDVPLWGSIVPVSLHCDSQGAIGIAMKYACNDKNGDIFALDTEQ